eukprot:TRINITY_DN100866_c0_g1_i1.p1 TRINITY_DN100866_c0_g1~~TRINITY_DN100866_c0_g1_i1.p1  ORF type:complete len:387 (-),score=74.00 TRINITY_DN100866_c0_g1_i1:54-1214(-)
MKAVVQRVTRASTERGEQVANPIDSGLVVFVSVSGTASKAHAENLAEEVLSLKLWPELGRADRPWQSNVMDNGYEVLAVLQPPTTGDIAALRPMFETFVAALGRGYQPEMIVAANVEPDAKVELTIDCTRVFELTGQSTPASRSTAGQQKSDESIAMAVRQLRRISELPASRARAEAARLYNVLSSRKFQSAVVTIPDIQAQDFAQALGNALQLFEGEQQDHLLSSFGELVADKGREEVKQEEDEAGDRTRPDWYGRAAPRTPGSRPLMAPWQPKGRGKGFKGTRAVGGIVSLDESSRLHGLSSRPYGRQQLERFNDSNTQVGMIKTEPGVASRPARKRSAYAVPPAMKFQKGTPTLAPMTPATAGRGGGGAAGDEEYDDMEHEDL